MKIRTTLFVLIVLLLVMNVLPVVPASVEAAYTITFKMDAVDCHNIKVSGQAYYSEGQINRLWIILHDSDYHPIKSIDMTTNPFVYTLKDLNYNQTYYLTAHCTLDNSDVTHFESARIEVKTPLEPILAGSLSNITSSSVMLTTKVTVNSNVLKTVGYRVRRASDNVLVTSKVTMTNVSTGGTRSDTISSLSPNTSYNVYVYLETQLGWKKEFGPYNFKTKFPITTIYPIPTKSPTATPKPTSTPTPKPSPTSSPTPSPTSMPTPTITAAPTPTLTPKPTSTPTPKPTAASTTEQTTAQTTESSPETTQAVTNTPTPEQTTVATTSQPTETTSLQITTTPATTKTQETTPEPTQPQGNDNNEFPWTVLIVALVAIAGIGFGVGGALMVMARKKK